MALWFLSKTTFTLLGSFTSSDLVISEVRVAICTAGFSKSWMSRLMTSPVMKGSSPCTLMTTSLACIPNCRAASPQRSVPDGRVGEVITACPPKPVTQVAMRSSSVATHTWSALEVRAASYTCCIMGLPWIRASGLPGKRVEA